MPTPKILLLLVAMFGLSGETIAQGGLIIITLIVFAESGMLVGFFLPGDTLLITAGVLAAQGQLTLLTTILAIFGAAVIGDNVGYTIGKLSGKRLFHKKDGLLFRHEYIERSEAFYEKHGAKTMIVARFVPIVRSFAPIVAGIGKMPRSRFILYDTIGALLWAVGVTLLGYFVGSKIPNIGKYLEYVVIGVMVLAIAPALWHVLKEPESRKLLRQKIKRLFRRKRHADAEQDGE